MTVLTSVQRRPHKQARFNAPAKTHFHRRLFSLIDGHDLERNRRFMDMRASGAVSYLANGKARKTYSACRSGAMYVREEVKQTARATAKALLHYADHTFNADFLFEVRLSTIELAKACNQYQEKEGDKRMSYEPMRRMLNYFVELGYLIEVTGWDAGTQSRAAKRYFLTPEFFKAFGIKPSEAGEFVRKRYLSLPVSKRQQEMTNYNEWQTRIKRQNNIAQIRSRYLATKLRTLKAEFIERPEEPLPPPESQLDRNTQAEIKLEERKASLIARAVKLELGELAITIADNLKSPNSDPPERRRYQLQMTITALQKLLES